MQHNAQSASCVPDGFVAFYLTGGKQTQANKTRTMSDSEVSFALQRADVIQQISRNGPEKLSQAAKAFSQQLSHDDLEALSWEADCQGIAGAKDSLPRTSLIYQAMNRRRAPVKPPKPIRSGLTVTDIAERIETDKETAARLLERAGWLVMAPHGGTQQRRIVPDSVILRGDGDNIRDEKSGQCFPVFAPERIENIVWTLGWDKIVAGANMQPTKKAQARWLLDHHSYLPDKTIAQMSGAGLRTIKRIRHAL